eukprot:tig00021462_g21583.t1
MHLQVPPPRREEARSAVGNVAAVAGDSSRGGPSLPSGGPPAPIASGLTRANCILPPDRVRSRKGGGPPELLYPPLDLSAVLASASEPAPPAAAESPREAPPDTPGKAEKVPGTPAKAPSFGRSDRSPSPKKKEVVSESAEREATLKAQLEELSRSCHELESEKESAFRLAGQLEAQIDGLAALQERDTFRQQLERAGSPAGIKARRRPPELQEPPEGWNSEPVPPAQRPAVAPDAKQKPAERGGGVRAMRERFESSPGTPRAGGAQQTMSLSPVPFPRLATTPRPASLREGATQTEPPAALAAAPAPAAAAATGLSGDAESDLKAEVASLRTQLEFWRRQAETGRGRTFSEGGGPTPTKAIRPSPPRSVEDLAARRGVPAEELRSKVRDSHALVSEVDALLAKDLEGEPGAPAAAAGEAVDWEGVTRRMQRLRHALERAVAGDMQALTEAASEIRSNAAQMQELVGRAEEQRRAAEARAAGLAGPARSLLASVAAVEGAFTRAF